MAHQDEAYTYAVTKYIRHTTEWTQVYTTEQHSTHADVASANTALHKLYHKVNDPCVSYSIQAPDWSRSRDAETGLFSYGYSCHHGNSATKMTLNITKQKAPPRPTVELAHTAKSRGGMKEAMKQEMWADLWDEIRRETLSDEGVMQAMMDEVKHELKSQIRDEELDDLRGEVKEAIREEEMDDLREAVRAAVREEEGERHRAELRRLFGGLRGSLLSRTPSIASAGASPGSRPIGVQKWRRGC